MSVKVSTKKRVLSRTVEAGLAAAILSGNLTTFMAANGLGDGDLSDHARNAVATLLRESARLAQELERIEARASHLERLADEDALMPVANRRAFMRELSRLVSLAQRYQTESSVVYIDLNGMKQINDRYGHNAGDAALQHVARILLDHVRHADVVARLGGDEFGVLLVKTDQAAADEKAAALAQAIGARPLIWNNQPIRLSAAVGAHCIRGTESVGQAIEAADRAMYQTKQMMKAALATA